MSVHPSVVAAVAQGVHVQDRIQEATAQRLEAYQEASSWGTGQHVALS